MANPKLNAKQLESLKDMVKQGVAPEDLAKHFKVAISSIHNYKAQFKKDGVIFPDVRGKRPKGSVTPGAGAVKGSGTGDKSTALTPQSSAETMTFVVNGSIIHVEGHAKDVVIAQDQIKVTF